MMRKLVCVTILFNMLNFSSRAVPLNLKVDNLPRIPGAVLLLGYPPFSLSVTTGEKTWKLQDDRQSDAFVSASMSTDGNIIASAHRIVGEPFTRAPKLVVSTYSIADREWTDHKALEILVGSVSISPDGTELACVTRNMPGEPSGLRILDLKTGKMTVGAQMAERAGTGISWSPDGKRITFDKDTEKSSDSRFLRPTKAIYILDVDAKAVSKVTDGMSPSWSPSGEWIAFISLATEAHSQNQYLLKIVHPDGSGARVVMTFRSDVVPRLKAVWSPDSERLLINVSRNPDRETWDIYMLDLSTLHAVRKFANTPPVFAWAVAK